MDESVILRSTRVRMAVNLALRYVVMARIIYRYDTSILWYHNIGHHGLDRGHLRSNAT